MDSQVLEREPTRQDVPIVQPTVQVHPLTFTGSASEYFRIWIVNMALTIITLGLLQCLG